METLCSGFTTSAPGFAICRNSKFRFAQLRLPQLSQFIAAQILLLSRPLRRCQLRAQPLEVAACEFRLFRQQLREGFVNLRVPLGEPLAQFFADAFKLKISSRTIANPIAESPSSRASS